MKETDKSGKSENKIKIQSDQYFQEIARNFLKQRGAPFFLSSKDLDLISVWEGMGIPLQVVLEGMKKAFESFPTKKRGRHKIRSLQFCKRQVLMSFEQFRERKIGKQRGGYKRGDKRTKIKHEVQRFLDNLPSCFHCIEEKYKRVLKMLSQSNVKEEEFERMEEEIEELLFLHCPRKEKEKIEREILREYSHKREEELSSLLKTKLIKTLREKHEIPYISLFYY